jgi:hypothetical protein
MVLPDDLVEGTRPHAYGQRCAIGRAVVSRRLEEVHATTVARRPDRRPPDVLTTSHRRHSPTAARRHNDPVLASLGRFCFHHRRLVLVGWLVAFVVGLGVGVQVFRA